jgi:catechol 2,3-dioxygenase
LPVHRDPDGTAYLKGWDEWDFYSVILVEADEAGIDSFAFKVESEADLDRYREASLGHGVAVAECEAGEVPFCGRALAVTLPSGHLMHLYAESVSTERPPAISIRPWPDGLKGQGSTGSTM